MIIFILKGINMPWIKQDLTGQRFGKLVAIESIRKIHAGWIWKCKCDCGNETECVAARLKLGRKRSCGCSLRGEGHYMWSGYKGLSGYSWCRVLTRAKIRKIDVDITVKDAWELFEKQNGKCALTGIDLQFARNSKGHVHGEQTASLDRIDSHKGYIKDNVQWIHKDLNTMKWDFSENDFIFWCKKVAEHFKNKDVNQLDLNSSCRPRWENRHEKKNSKTDR